MRRLLIVMLATSFMYAICVAQATLTVPSPYATIQAAIDAAVDGDTVLVSEGRYIENLVVPKNIVLASLFLIDSEELHIKNTILDGSQPSDPAFGTVVTVDSATTEALLICGFTITGGTGQDIVASDGTGNWRVGGGINLRSGSATIRRNIIEYNSLTGTQVSGSGLTSEQSLPKSRIEQNIIRYNTTEGMQANEGAITLGSSADVVNNLIVHNSSATSTPTYAAGILVWGNSADCTIMNNTVAFNTCFGGISGITAWTGIWITVRIINNIFWNPGIADESYGEHTGKFTYNIIRTAAFGQQNLYGDPLFIDTTDFLLSPDSPCLNAGAPAESLQTLGLVMPETDLRGYSRPSPAGSRADLGAFESITPAAQPSATGSLGMTLGEFLSRPYAISIPEETSDEFKPPLLVFLHGGLGSWITGIDFGFRSVAARQHFAIALPQGTPNTTTFGYSWDALRGLASDDIAFLSDFIEHMITTYDLDRTRVYLSGWSNGAAMTYIYAYAKPLSIAGIGIIAGTTPRDMSFEIPTRRPVPLVAFHGTNDPAIGFDGGQKAALDWTRSHGNTSEAEVVSAPDPILGGVYSITRFDYPSVDERKDMRFFEIKSGEHSPRAWGGFPMAEEMWKFFSCIGTPYEPPSASAQTAHKILSVNYPNPFNPTTHIRYTLPWDARVRVSIYNTLGQHCETLVRNEIQSAGEREVFWDASHVASGVYFYRVEATDGIDQHLFTTDRMLLVR